MNRQKIDYGIDLGTTNSSIARMQNGVATIIKNDLQKDTTPSCVYFSKAGQLCVGEEALRRFKRDAARGIADRAAMEFKTRLGTDQVYRFAGVDTTYTPEALSAEVLRALRGFVRDEPVDAAVISVPAAFSQVQVEATQAAAQLAGLTAVDLVPEPLAASITFSVSTKSAANSHWLVFDLGGGTFDAVLMRMPEGLMRVVDIAGDNRLGGKDIDRLIVEQLLLPAISREQPIGKLLYDPQRHERLAELLKWLYAEDAKIALSSHASVTVEIEAGLVEDDEGKPLGEQVVEITRPQLETLMAPMLNRAVQISQRLLERNKLKADDLSTVLLIGGPTCMPCVREAVRAHICSRADWHVDPMTAVAVGACLHASTRDRPRQACRRDPSRVQLRLAYPETTVESQVALGVRLEQGPQSAASRVQVLRLDRGWSSDVVSLEKGGGLLQLSLVANRPNEFEIRLTDSHGSIVPCEPERITILQGIKIDDPPLPFDICVEAGTSQGDRLVPVLRKGQQLPATGVACGLRTRVELRPGASRDVVTIPVYEGEAGTRAIHNRWLGELRLNGGPVGQRLPAGAEVEVTISIDASRRKTVSAFVPYLDETFEEVMAPLQKTHLDPAALNSSLADADSRIERMEERLNSRGNGKVAGFRLSLEQARGLEGEASLERLRELHRGLDGYEAEMAGALMAGKCTNELEVIAREVSVHGTVEERAEFASLREGAEADIAQMDAALADRAMRRTRPLFWRIVERRPDYWMGCLYQLRDDYEVIRWRDRERASALLKQADKLTDKGYQPEVNSIVEELWRLRSNGEEQGRRTDILERVR